MNNHNEDPVYNDAYFESLVTEMRNNPLTHRYVRDTNGKLSEEPVVHTATELWQGVAYFYPSGDCSSREMLCEVYDDKSIAEARVRQLETHKLNFHTDERACEDSGLPWGKDPRITIQMGKLWIYKSKKSVEYAEAKRAKRSLQAAYLKPFFGGK